MNENILEYYELCRELNDGTTKEDIRRHNLAMKKLTKLYKKLANVEDKSFVHMLLDNQDVQVSFIVATHCLGWGIYQKEAKKVLNRLARMKDNTELAFDAKMTLEIYKEQGYIEI